MLHRLPLLPVCDFLCASAPSPDAAPSGDGTWCSELARPAEGPYPDADPYAAAKASLGDRLFHDGRLSRSGRTACSTCHEATLSWGDGLPRAIGEGHAPLPLRSPTLLGVAWGRRLGWDGRFRDLEAVALGPLLNPANMNMTEGEVTQRLVADPTYVKAFVDAFGTGPDKGGIERALATYERSIVPRTAPFDRWVGGDEKAVTPQARRGFALFRGNAGCSACHSR